MTFVTTSLAVAGLLAAAIPIIIHLLSRQRRKPIEWAAMRFLLEALRKHRRRLRTEQLLLLAVRCLLVILFGAALARPLLTQVGILDRGGDRVVYLLIDNGMISGVTDEFGRSALEAHIQQGVNIIRSLQPGDRVGVATAARPTRLVISPPSTDHGSAMAYLESLRPTDSPTDIGGALRIIRPVLEEHAAERTSTFVYLLSELRAGSAPLEFPIPAELRGLGEQVALLAPEPAQAPAPNVQITSVDPVRHIVLPGTADGSGQITVRLERHGGDLGSDITRVRLRGDGINRVEPRIVQWEPGQSQAAADFLVTYAPGPPGQSGAREVVITAQVDDDALAADNVRHTVLEQREHLRIALLDRRVFGFEPTLEGFRSGQWIRRALQPGDVGPVQVTEVEPAALGEADLRAADVAIATRPDLLTETGWEVLRGYVDRGGVLLVMPPGELNVHPWTERFISAMDLPWRIQLEVVDHEGGLPLASEQPQSEMLRLISSDLDELARPVMSFRVLPVEGEMLTPLLLMADGRPLLAQATSGGRQAARDDRPEQTGPELDGAESADPARGLVLYLASAPQLDWTNLPGRPLMVPLMHELVRQSISWVRGMRQATTGDRPVIGVRSARELVGITNGSDERFSIDSAGRPQRPLASSGAYEVRDAAGQRLTTMAVNIDPRSGRTQTHASAAVMAWLAGSDSQADRAGGARWSMFDPSDPAGAIQTAETGSPIAWLLLWIVLGLLAIETLLQRWFSHATLAEEQRFGSLRGGIRATIRKTGEVVRVTKPSAGGEAA